MGNNSQRPNSQHPIHAITSPESAFSRRQGRWLVAALGVCILAASLAGCAKARAATVPDGPPLAMPLPPPRVFAPVEQEEPLAAGPAVPETPATEAPSVPQRPIRRATAPREDKPEPAPQPPQPAPEPQRELRAATAPADAEAERKIRSLLQLASRTLGNVDYQKLSIPGREQYQQAKDFSEQAGEALTQRNYVFAETLADKAAKLATELSGR
jgi:hypothetical protein